MDNLLDHYSSDELKTIDIKLLDLTKQEWGFSRGAKTTRDYLYDNGKVAIRIKYTYTYSNGDRDVHTVARHIDFFDSDENVFYNRDISKPMNITQLGDLNEEIRKGRVHYMREAVKGLPAFSPYVPEPWKSDFLKGPEAGEVLTQYYKEEMIDYEANGSLFFEEKILAESNQFMMSVLNLNVRPPDAEFPIGLTIKQSIMHQLTGNYN